MTLQTPAMRRRLDALDGLLRGEGSPGQADASLAPLVAAARRLEALRPAPSLPAASLAASRQALLAQVTLARRAARQPARVPAGPSLSWLRNLFSRLAGALLPSTPVRRPFAPALAVILLAAVLAFSGFALNGVEVASRSSLPGDGLYAFKIAQENLGLALTRDSADRITLYMQLAQNRSQELFALAQAGRPVPAETAARLQQHIQSALVTAGTLPDAQMEDALAQIRQASLDSSVVLQEAAGLVEDEQSRFSLALATSALTAASHLAEEGLQDPDGFRDQVGNPALLPTPTLVIALPTATNVLYNPPAGTSTAPVSTDTSAIPGGTQAPATATSTSQAAATLPVPPTSTPIQAGGTAQPPTPTRTAQPSATRTPEPPPAYPTPTPVSQQGGG